MQAWEIENRGFLASAAPPLAGFFIEDQSNPGAQIEVGLFTSLAAINGLEDNADGTQAGLLTQRQVTNVALAIDERYRSGELRFYLDERFAGWDSSRGFGVRYAYHKQNYRLRFDMPSLLTNPDIAASIGNDVSFSYDYGLTSHHVLFPVDFSIGRPLIAGITVFLSGSATVGLVVTQLDGRQEGPCYTTCEFTTAPFD